MEHRVYTGLTKPIIFIGVPIVIFAIEMLMVAVIYVIIRVPPYFLLFIPPLHISAVMATARDVNWYKAAIVKGKFFSGNRSLLQKRVRYNA